MAFITTVIYTQIYLVVVHVIHKLAAIDPFDKVCLRQIVIAIKAVININTGTPPGGMQIN